MRYAAFVAGNYVEAGDDLDALVRLVQGLMSPDAPEDVTVWDGNRLAVLLLHDGCAVRFLPGAIDKVSV